MFDFGLCPRCQNEISQERQSDQVLVCDHCGWTPQTSNERMAKKISRRSLFAMLGLSVLVSSLYIHSLYWGKYSLEILPLKWKEYTQSATDIDYKKMADICKERFLFSCSEMAYSKAFQVNPKDVENLSLLGGLQIRLKDYEQAIQTFQKYFQSGGQQSDIAYKYAKLLERAGKINEAKNYFQYSLDAKPDVFQVSLLKDYVNFLIKNDFLKDAQNLILKVRKQGDNDPQFMEKELQLIKKRLVLASR